MAEKDYAPLTSALVRALNDKLYEKRKVAALEIERMVREFVAQNKTNQIRSLLQVLGQDFTLSHNPNSRKGGLIGLAATAIALGKETCGGYVQELVKPILACFFDSDSRVRYYGCEALYNIVKVAWASVLPFFNDIFDGLSRLAADPDQNVRSGAELLDRLMKDIITESDTFDLDAFVPLLRERIYTKNSFARQFVVSWVSTLDAVPGIDILRVLSEVLDGLFHILGDGNPEIRKMCESVLSDLLRGITQSPENVNYCGMTNILIVHCQSTDLVIQYTALCWLKEFVQLSGRATLPFSSGLLCALLPCLSYDEGERRRNIRDAARSVNTILLGLVTMEDDDEECERRGEGGGEGGGEERKASGKKEDAAAESTDIIEKFDRDVEKSDKGIDTSSDSRIELDVSSLIEVLSRQFSHDKVATRIAALRWVYHLLVNTPNKTFRHVDELFPLLLKMFSDPSDEVVLLVLEVLAEVSTGCAGHRRPPLSHQLPTSPGGAARGVGGRGGPPGGGTEVNGYFEAFLLSLLQLFSTDRQLLDERGTFIIRRLCVLLNAEDIYRCLSDILAVEPDVKFGAHMVQTLNTILLTATELFELRLRLKLLDSEASCSLFCCLYRSWCHSPVSTVALCFLTQNYQHASDLLTLFGDLEVTVQFLTEIDKLIQLIESPIFTYLRLQLLEADQFLLKSLYALLMLLPQSAAFQTLQHRLAAIPPISFPPTQPRVGARDIDFAELLAHFKEIQQRHRLNRHHPDTLDDIDKKYSPS